MRVYVAAGFAAYERARALMDYAQTIGYEVTHDWTRTESFGEDGHPRSTLASRERDLDENVRLKRAQEDVEGVRSCDILILLSDTDPYGGLMETGMAIAAGKEVWVVGENRYSIFWSLPKVLEMRDDEDARCRLLVLTALPRCGAQDWCFNDDGSIHVWGTCDLPSGHEGRWHREVREGNLWAEWSGPVIRAPAPCSGCAGGNCLAGAGGPGEGEYCRQLGAHR